MPQAGPPAYAWDWFARQRLLWRDARARLEQVSAPAATRYATVETRSDVLVLLRADYPRDEIVRATVDAVIAEGAFLGRIDVPFARLGLTNAPRGLRWWWTALTGEDLDRSDAMQAPPRGPDPTQLSLDEVHEGYGG